MYELYYFKTTQKDNHDGHINDKHLKLKEKILSSPSSRELIEWSRRTRSKVIRITEFFVQQWTPSRIMGGHGCLSSQP